MRILVITRSAWRNDDSTGNTCSSIFGSFSDASIYSLYLRDNLPNNDIALKSFSISEGQLIKGLFGKNPAGRYVEKSKGSVQPSNEDKAYSIAKRLNWTLLAFAREILWCVANWKNEKLESFLKDASPDIIFMPVFNCYYPHKILRYVQKYTNAKVVLFHADDNYTLKQFSLSPIYWLYRFGLRNHVRKSVKLSDINYCISEVQKQDYEKLFLKELKILTKYDEFNELNSTEYRPNQPLRLVYTGNINVNRWKSLAKIVEALREINNDKILAQLWIYTATDITKKMRRKLYVDGTSFLMKAVSFDEVVRIQQNADFLVHVEALDLKNRLAVRQSFSTKIVDYLKRQKPILAFGPKNVASIKHLIDNDCALVADTKNELLFKLNECITNSRIMHKYATNAYLCGMKHHNKEDVLKMLQTDFYTLYKKK